MLGHMHEHLFPDQRGYIGGKLGPQRLKLGSYPFNENLHTGFEPRNGEYVEILIFKSGNRHECDGLPVVYDEYLLNSAFG
jgi:hypothetical protein